VWTSVARGLEVAYRRCEYECSVRSRRRWIIKRETNSAYRRVVLRVACVSLSVTFAIW